MKYFAWYSMSRRHWWVMESIDEFESSYHCSAEDQEDAEAQAEILNRKGD